FLLVHLKVYSGTQAFGDDLFVSPERRGWHAGRGRGVTAGDLEHLAYKTLRRPIAHGDQAAGTTNPLELGSNDLRTRSEHRSEHGENHVELARRIRQPFGVAFNEFNFQVF